MFFVKDAWLRYEPFNHYRLPEIVPQPYTGSYGTTPHTVALFTDKTTGKLAFKRPLYRLKWPGERNGGHNDGIPSTIMQHWPNAQSRRIKKINDDNAKTPLIKGGPVDAVKPISLSSLLSQEMLPPDDQIPEAIAYHLAVNHKLYFPNAGVQFPIAGLPARRVQQVFDSTFALDDKALAALRYLKWMAEGHHKHPLLQDFDTTVKETMGILGQTATELFFFLLYDCQYDMEKGWWAKGDRGLAFQIPLYMHWVGRTGMGLYADHATIPPGARHCSDPSWDERYPDVLDQLKRWNMDKMRGYMHESGGEPQGKGECPPSAG